MASLASLRDGDLFVRGAAVEGDGVLDGGVAAGGEPVVVAVDGLLRRRPAVDLWWCLWLRGC